LTKTGQRPSTRRGAASRSPPRSATPGLVPASAAAVPAPKLSWQPCADPAQKRFQRATAHRLPLDYGHPRGHTTDPAVTSHRAADRAHPIGRCSSIPGGRAAEVQPRARVYGAAIP
jgi:hypothetical protein